MTGQRILYHILGVASWRMPRYDTYHDTWLTIRYVSRYAKMAATDIITDAFADEAAKK